MSRTASRPLFRDNYHSKIRHFQQTVIRGGNRPGLGQLTRLAVGVLNGMDSIVEPLGLLRVLEIGTQIDPAGRLLLRFAVQ